MSIYIGHLAEVTRLDLTEDFTAFHLLREKLRQHPDARGQAALDAVGDVAREFASASHSTSAWDADWEKIEAARLAVERALAAPDPGDN